MDTHLVLVIGKVKEGLEAPQTHHCHLNVILNVNVVKAELKAIFFSFFQVYI